MLIKMFIIIIRGINAQNSRIEDIIRVSNSYGDMLLENMTEDNRSGSRTLHLRGSI